MRGFNHGRNEIETGADSECRDKSAQNNTGILSEFDQPLKFCTAENKKGGHPRKGVTTEWSKQKSVCGISVVKCEIAAVFTAAISSFGGPDRIRTDDPHNANVMRSQLHYRPILTVFQSKKL